MENRISSGSSVVPSSSLAARRTPHMIRIAHPARVRCLSKGLFRCPKLMIPYPLLGQCELSDHTWAAYPTVRRSPPPPPSPLPESLHPSPPPPPPHPSHVASGQRLVGGEG